jgi:hypothetical protein
MSILQTLKDAWKVWMIGLWFKKPPEKLPPPRPELPDFDGPRFIDRFAERNSDPEFQKVDQKVRQAISNSNFQAGLKRG